MRAWSEAWHDALYGTSGFFLRQAPLDHFRTNAAVPLFAVAVRRLADLVDRALGFPDPFDVVDVGAGRGELLCALPDVPPRWRLTAVEVSVGPPGPLTWATSIPPLTGLLVANEWLDSVPLDVVEDGRLVLVSPDGQESLGAPLASEWADRWWPPGQLASSGGWASADPGRQEAPHRVELGAPRDAAWAAAVAQVVRGLAVAIDYGHTAADRRPTLTGYRDGRQVLPVPDGSCDLTAHVALDAVASTTGAVLTTQRDALLALGVSSTLPDTSTPPDVSARPDVSGAQVALATPQPGNSEARGGRSSYAADLARASQARELLDPDGLGGFGWLLNPVGVDLGWMGT